MPYKCSKCAKEFPLKRSFRNHMLRKTSCTTQTSLDAFLKAVDVMLGRRNEGREYLQNRLEELDLFFGNLSEAEQKEARQVYDQDVVPLIEELRAGSGR